MRYVIIGNSAAAVGAVEGIRKNDKQGEITIVSDEKYVAYSRPLISYLLQGKTTEQKMKYRSDNFYEDNKCNLILGVKAEKIDANTKTIELNDNRKIKYDKLLVATGSSAFVPQMSGLESVKNKFAFMNLDDCFALKKVIDENKKVLIIGAGLIGLKCAEGIKDSVFGITVVDLAPNILSSILDSDGAEIVKKHLENCGIKFKLSCGVEKIDEQTAYLNNGDKIEFDILVLAVGVRPNIELLKDIVDTEKAIIINGKSETSIKDIYSAGDCTQTIDVSSGESKVMALLPNAYMQGEVAGINMSGGDAAFGQAIPMNAIGFFGLHIITAGSYCGETYCAKEQENYKKLFYSDNKLNGYILVGETDKAGIYTAMVRNKTPLDNLDFELICKKPSLIAFSKQERKIKLGGEV